MKRANNEGITLIELIVTLAVIVVVMGGAIVGVALIASGDAEKAAKGIRSTLGEVRTDTLTIQAEWQARIINDDGTYKISVYRDGDEYDTLDLGARINISYGDANTSIGEGDELVISFRKSTGAIKSIEAGTIGGTLSPVALSDETQGFKITVSRTDTDYVLVLWRDTGKVTSGD